MARASSEITDIIKAQIRRFEGGIEPVDVGTVVEVGDGIARIQGLAGCMASELLDFGRDLYGLAFNLEEEIVSAIVLGDYARIKEGDEVRTTGRIAEVPVGDALVTRVVDGLGRPIDGKGPIKTTESRKIDLVAPRVITRKNVDTPVQTGIKVIDAITPIGRGQRELIIGDRQTGKTAVAIDTIINQRGQDLTCIYVAVGQKESSVAKIVATLEEHGAMEHTIVVMAGAADAATLQYLAPFAACAMGEYFRDKGQDALIVYDDLTKHAQAYRQVSLLTRRPPGREAYPGDVFYLHSRLLERAARLNEENGGGSVLDKATQQQLRRGERVTEIMKQPQYQPLSVDKEVVIIFAATSGYLDDVPTPKVGEFERDLYRYMDSVGKNVAARIAKDKVWNTEIEKDVRAMLEEFKKAHPYSDASVAKPPPEEKREPSTTP